MRLIKVKKLKTWLYKYNDTKEKEEHKKNMLIGGFKIEKETELEIEFSQIITESK